MDSLSFHLVQIIPVMSGHPEVIGVSATGTGNSKPTVSIQGSLGYVYIGHDPQVELFNFFLGSGVPSGGTYAWSSPDSSISFDNSSASSVHITATSYSGGFNDTEINLNYTENGEHANEASVNVTKRIFKYILSVLLSFSGTPSRVIAVVLRALDILIMQLTLYMRSLGRC